MKSKIEIAAVALLLGTATAAAAQAPARTQRFTEQFAQMQALSSTNTYAFKPAVVVADGPRAPLGNVSFADREREFQALSSSNPYALEPVQRAAGAPAPRVALAREPFARTFAGMQAVASNSGAYALPADSNAPAYEANTTLVTGRPFSVASIYRRR
jgi:hypothetical protein